MRTTALFSILFLSASALAAPSFGRISGRQSIQCAPVDDDGVPLSGSAPSGNFVSCEYDGGAGECTYFPADGSFSSGSSQCPPGVAQDPSATTDAPSTTGGATSTTPDSTPSSTPDTTPSSAPAVSSTDGSAPSTPVVSSTPAASTPAASTPAGSTPAASTTSASKTTTPTQTESATPSPSPSNAALRIGGAPGVLVVLAAMGLGAVL